MKIFWLKVKIKKTNKSLILKKNQTKKLLKIWMKNLKHKKETLI